MAIWRVEIAFDTTSVTGTADGGTTIPVQASRCVVVVDGLGNTYAIRTTLTWTFNSGTGIYTWESDFDLGVAELTQAATGFVDLFNPQNWQAYGTPVTAPGRGSYLSTGILAIEKDFGGGTLTIAGPMGSVLINLAALDAAIAGSPFGSGLPAASNDTALMPLALYHGHQLQDPTVSGSEISKWYNLAIKENGVTQSFVAMSAANPLMFAPSQPDPLVGPVTENNGQETSRYRTETDYTGGSFGFPVAGYYYDPITNQFGVAGAGLDSWKAPEHGFYLVVWCQQTGGLHFLWSDTFGHTYHELPIGAVGGATCTSPTVQWLAGKTVVVYYAGGQIQQTSSMDLGLTWRTPVPVSITGTNPRLVIDPVSGVYFYFYCDGGNLNVRRSMDGGLTLFDAGPIVVNDLAVPVTPQDIGAVAGPDLTLVAQYVSGGMLISRASRDFGATWHNA